MKNKIEVLHPNSDKAWHRLRQKDVTASVIGALLGVHEWTSYFRLFQSKTGNISRTDEETPAIRRGRLMEPVAVAALMEDYPTFGIAHNTGTFTRYFRSAEHRIGATPDILATDPARGLGVIQVKSVEQTIYRRKWMQDDGTVEPPLWIALQAMTEAWLTGATWAAVAPIVVGHGIEVPLVEIPILPHVIERLQKESAIFWKRVEDGDVPEPDYLMDGETINEIYPTRPGDEIDLTYDPDIMNLVNCRIDTTRTISNAEAVKETVDNRIRFKLAGASLAHLPGGLKLRNSVTRRRQDDGTVKEFTQLRMPSI